MSTKIRVWTLLTLALLFLALGLFVPQTTTPARSDPPVNQIVAHALDIEFGRVKAAKYEQHLSSGVMYAALQATGALEKRASAGPSLPNGPKSPISSANTQGCQNVFTGGGMRNVRVNQDCSLRRQAEEVIAINPTNPDNLIAGQNDSRIGFNHCGYDWSFDRGRTWGDQIPPFYQFILLDGHTADACSDPTATFDANGNAYVGGILFDINSVANAFVVAKSNAGIGGAFYHTPAALTFQTYRDIPLGVVANDNNPNIFHDKEFIVADANSNSPKKNNVYATWTRFAVTKAGVGVNSPIYFSQSTDGGATWSPGIEISGANPAFCTAFSGSANPNACDQDQGSHPIVGPDGTIYVSFFNGNTPELGVNQHLLVRCPKIGGNPATTNCASAANWSAPVIIAHDVGKQPIGPDPVTGCPAGRQCLPPNGYRVQDETYGSLSIDGRGVLYHVFSDFRNGVGSSCDWNNAQSGRAATAKPPCDNDVFYQYSTDGGATWSPVVNLTASRFHPSAQWQPWNAVAGNGSRLFVAYYDRSYGDCEFTGCNDITLAIVNNPASASPSINYVRITTSSMPNLVVANNPIQAGFLGDYMWVATDHGGRAHIVWADTRGLGGTVEEDIYYATYP